MNIRKFEFVEKTQFLYPTEGKTIYNHENTYLNFCFQKTTRGGA